MRKLFTSLATFVMLLTSTTVSKAQQYYEALNWPGDGVSAVEIGQNVVLQAANFQEGRFFNGTATSHKISEKCLYRFEQAESDISGKPTYYLKEVATGFYLQGKDWTDGAVKFAKSKFKAQPLWVQKAEHFYYRNFLKGATDDEWPKEGVEDWTTAAIYDSLHYKKTPPEGAFILSLSDQPEYFFTNMWGAGVSFSKSKDNNTWFVCEVEKLVGVDRLEAMFSDLFPTGKADMFKIGTEAGEVSESSAKAASEVVEQTTLLLESTDTSTEDFEQAADRLYKAYQDYFNSVIGVHSGYYLIHDYRCEMERPEYNYIFFDSYKDQPFLSLKQFSSKDKTPKIESLTVDDAMYVWHFEKQKNGKFKVKSLASDMYVEAAVKRIHPRNRGRYFLISKDPAAAGEFIINPSPVFKGGFNITVGPKFSDRHGMWNTARTGAIWGICEWYDYNDTGSTWKFTPVSDAIIEPLKDGVREKMDELRIKARNQRMRKLINTAKSAYNANEKYISVEGVNNVSSEGVYNFQNMGLCPEVSMLSSNAADSGPGKELGALVDNKKSTFFHTTWHANQNIKEPHYIQFNLTQAVRVAEIQLLKRQHPTGELKEVKIVASNDPNAVDDDWIDIGTFGVQYDKDCQMPKDDDSELFDTLTANAAVIGFSMPDAFSNIRMICVRNAQNAGPHGYQWMHMAEARVYPAVYDADGSLNKAVDQEVKEHLLATIQEGERELNEEKASEAALERLSKAYDNYVKATPKPQVIKDRCQSYKVFCKNAAEGDELGFFEEGAKEEFSDVIESVQAEWQETMTLKSVKLALKRLDDAFATFNEKLHKPESGKYYRIVCATGGKDAEDNPLFQYGHYLYAANSGDTPIHWGGRSDDGVDEEGLENKLAFYWKVISNGDGTYKFQNAAYGTYLGNDKENLSASVCMRLNDDSTSVRFTSFQPGTFNVQLLNGLYLNINPDKTYRKVQTWNMPAANSLFTFQEVEEWDAEESLSRIWAGNEARLKTLPYAVNPKGTMNAILYSVLGVNKPFEESCRIYLEFKKCTDVIPGGTPFLVVPEKEENEDGELVPLDWVDLQVAGIENGLEDIVYTQVAGKQECDGTILSGALLPTNMNSQSYFINGKGNLVLVCEKEGHTGYNSGWFSCLAATLEKGDYHIQVDPDAWQNICNGIDEVTLTTSNDKIYNIQGQQVKKLEKGIYIIKGKKVIR